MFAAISLKAFVANKAIDPKIKVLVGTFSANSCNILSDLNPWLVLVSIVSLAPLLIVM